MPVSRFCNGYKCFSGAKDFFNLSKNFPMQKLDSSTVYQLVTLLQIPLPGNTPVFSNGYHISSGRDMAYVQRPAKKLSEK